MDWSPPSRRSASRREQNLALLGAVVSGAVIATGVLLLLIARVNPGQGAALRGAAADVVMPVWSVVRAPLEALDNAVAGVGAYFGAVSRNRLLTAELAAGRARLQRADAEAQANVQLMRLLRVVEPRVRLIVTARIAGASSGGTLRSALISAGARDGVRPGQPVRAAAGLVGRTLEAGSHATRVLLLTDPGSRIPVVVARTGQPALLVGANAPLLEVRDRVGAEIPLRVGDRLVTSGDGGVYAPGIPAAVVVRASEPPLARPAASPDGLGYVAVETPYLPVPAVAAAAETVPVPREAGGGKVKKVVGGPVANIAPVTSSVIPANAGTHLLNPRDMGPGVRRDDAARSDPAATPRAPAPSLHPAASARTADSPVPSPR